MPAHQPLGGCSTTFEHTDTFTGLNLHLHPSLLADGLTYTKAFDSEVKPLGQSFYLSLLTYGQLVKEPCSMLWESAT